MRVSSRWERRPVWSVDQLSACWQPERLPPFHSAAQDQYIRLPSLLQHLIPGNFKIRSSLQKASGALTLLSKH
jgi:hypothetical protein